MTLVVTSLDGMQTGSRNPPKPEVVKTGQRDLFQRDLSGFDSSLARPIHFHLRRHTTHSPTVETTIRYKLKIETVPQTGSTNNLETKTDIDAISVILVVIFSVTKL